MRSSLRLEEFLEDRRIKGPFFFSRQILGDLDTPLSYYMKMKYANPEGFSFLLESVEQKERAGRYSFIGFDPYLIFKSLGKRVFLSGIVEDEVEVENPFLLLKEIIRRLKRNDPLLTFGVGATGYVSYDVVRFFEDLPDEKPRKINMYDMYFLFPSRIVIFDNYTRKFTLLVGKMEGVEKKFDEREMLDELKIMLRFPLRIDRKREFSVIREGSNMSREEFEGMVRRGKDYIKEGDVIQVVLSQRFFFEADCDSLSLYRALRVINPSPYMFLLEFPEYSIVGSSPETMVKMKGREIEVKPIAGTRPRGKTEKEDKALERDLLSDEKEVAEHVMLVDLGRNDVGRVSKAKTVKVPEFMKVERYSHVMHIVSSVKGIVEDGLDAFDVFKACFPAGTVTGAPKIRAMQIIEELEKEKREFYAGAVGYFALNGDMDFCITIRTLLKKENILYVQAGAGIVADSIPEREYEETLNKARAIKEAIDTLKEILE